MKLGAPIDLSPEELAGLEPEVGYSAPNNPNLPSPAVMPEAASPAERSAGPQSQIPPEPVGAPPERAVLSPQSEPVAAPAGPVLGEPVDLSPEELAAAGEEPAGPRLGSPIDPLDDFEIYNAIEDEKEARGYDPTDPGIPAKIWEGAKSLVGQIPGALKGLGTLIVAKDNPVRQPEAAALLATTAGKLLGNYNVLGKGADALTQKLVNKAAAIASPEQEQEMKRLSRQAAWQFQREVRDTEMVTTDFNRHLETIFPEALKGFGSLPVDQEAAAGLSLVADPANMVPVGAAARWTAAAPLRGAVRAAESAVKSAALDVARAQAQRESALLLLKPSLSAAERAPLFSKATAVLKELDAAKVRQAQATRALQGTVSAQRAVIDRMATDVSALPMVTRGASLGARAVGSVADSVGRGLQKVAAIPEVLATKIAGGADQAAQRGIADGVRNLTGAFGVVPAAAGATGATLRNAGRNLKVFGRVLSEAEGQLPFFKRLARETDGLTSWTASLVDQTGLGQMVAPTGRIAADASRAVPFTAAMGFAGSGGDADAAAAGAGGGMVFGLAGGAYGQWQRFASPALFRQRQLADVGRYRQALPTDDARVHFDKMPVQDRAALATMQLAHPDLAIKHERLGAGRPSFYYAAEDGPVAVINLDTKDGVNAVLAHEIGHHVEKHGLGGVVDRTLFGDPVLKRPGMFTELDTNGAPVVAPDGTYAKNAEWAGLKDSYNARIKSATDRTGDYLAARDDAGIGREVFAEHVAGYLTGREFPKALQSNLWTRALAGIADSSLVSGAPALKQMMGKFGVPLTGVERVVGSDLFKGGLPASKDLQRLISDYHQKSARGRTPTIDDEGGGTRYTAAEVTKHPEVLDRLFDGTDDVARDKRGRVIREKDGSPRFQTTKEQLGQRKALADALVNEIERSAGAGEKSLARVERVVDDRSGAVQEGWVTPAIPDAVLDRLAAQEKFNPVQIDNLRQISRQIRAQQGNSSLFFYQPAKGPRGSYKSLAGDWRTETPYAIFISKAGNVLIRTISREKLVANAQGLVAKRGADLWDNNIGSLVKDVDTYLANHAAGKPGSEGIGIEKRDQINALFGIGTKRNMAANPLLETSPKSPVVIRSRRLDRINRLTPVEETFKADYEKLNANLRPESSELSGDFLAASAPVKRQMLGNVRPVTPPLSTGRPADRLSGGKPVAPAPVLPSWYARFRTK